MVSNMNMIPTVVLLTLMQNSIRRCNVVNLSAKYDYGTSNSAIFDDSALSPSIKFSLSSIIHNN